MAEYSLRGDGWVEIDETSLPWLVAVWVEVVDGAPRLLGLHLEPRPGSTVNEVVISAESLRKLPLRHLIRQGLDVSRLNVKAVLDRRGTDAEVGTREHLEAVAEAYLFAVSQGESPRKLIAKKWGRSPKTVDVWIDKARKATPPLLGPARPGRTGGAP